MSIPWITLTPSLNDGIKLINSTDPVKFPLLLSRLFNAVQNNISEPFSKDEIQKLEKSLNMNSEDLKLMLESTIYIIKRSKSFLMKPTVLQEELVDKMQFDLAKAEVFVKFWTENAKVDFDLQNRLKLQGLSWELNLETASDSDLKKTLPTSILQFQVKDNKDELQNITVEMTEQDLLHMYNEIENIQNHLDSINK